MMFDESKTNELLARHLQNMNIYDLIQLKKCFEWEYEHRLEEKDFIQSILDHIQASIDEKEGKN